MWSKCITRNSNEEAEVYIKRVNDMKSICPHVGQIFNDLTSDKFLEKLGEKDPEENLPAWWMSKITLAADYLNKADNYINTSGQLNDVSYEQIRKNKS